jgi:CRP-like cAMP-binding protein/Fe-S-cluster-containing hydrogenase component 2
MDFYLDLAEQVHDELQACIGCHACMRACPLPSAETVTIAALNDVARGAPMTALVAEFVEECTQCHQCVPVCPVDIHRSAIVLWNKLKLDPDPDRPLTVDVAGHSMQSGWTVGTLARYLTKLPLFTGVSDIQVRQMMSKIALKRLLPGAVLSREGEYGQSLYIIIAGMVELGAATERKLAQRLVTLGPGSFANEMSVLADRPNDVTVTAVEETLVVECSRWSIRQLMRESPAFAARMEGMYRKRALDTYIRQVPLFDAVPDEALTQLLDRSRLEVYQPGMEIIHEGDAADAFYIVRAGFAKIVHTVNGRPVVVSYLHEGDYFGEMALLSGGRRNASVIAATRAEVVVIGQGLFGQILSRYPGVRDQLQRVAAERQQAGERGLSLPDASTLGSVECLLAEGLLQANNLLIIDQRICVDCDNCVDACARRHGHTRLARRGITLGPILFPGACRHCEDPVCLLCSVDGIVRAPDGSIQIVAENCVGCGACAERCPYDNIQMAQREPAAPNLLQKWFPKIFGLPEPSQGSIFDRIAVKCDLCAGYDDGPACVHNCPTGAAQRVNPIQFFEKADLGL